MKLRLFLMMLFLVGVSFAQDIPSNYQTKKVAVSDTIQIDKVSINPSKFQIYDKNSNLVDTLDYHVDFRKSVLLFSEKFKKINDTVTINYLRYPDFLTRDYFVLDSTIIVQNNSSINKLYSLQESTNTNNFKPFDGLNTIGSISRGITIGNNQNAVVNSDLNLQITGKLSDKVSIRASIQDANIPTQNGGYSQSLDEFDQIFMELYSDNWNIRAGDVDLINQNSYFEKFRKKVQGISLGGTINHENGAKTTAFLAGALVRGVFSESNFVGQEGNQGPYKLVGPNGELYILIVSGSERVYVNGLLLKRGVDENYIIDYNAGELKFNPTYPITANMRIKVEYQYTNQNYTRFIGYGGGNYTTNTLDFGVYVYSESDAKNQPLQQNLSEEQVAILKEAGDDRTKMIAPSAVPDTYSENKILYKKEVIEGIEIFVFSSNPEDELYNVRFTLVGEGLGNYVLTNNSAINRIYEYIAPKNGISQGDYAPIIQLTAPKKLQIGGINGRFHPSEKTNILFEIAGSKNDLNLFSELDNENNDGFAGRISGQQTILKPSERMKIDAIVSLDYINEDFRNIERTYSVEFDRDWNTNIQYSGFGDQLFLTAGLDLSDTKFGTIRYEFQNRNLSASDTFGKFEGTRHVLGSILSLGNFNLYTNGSSLESKSDLLKSNFFRFNNTTTYSFEKAWIGGKINLEDNQVRTIAKDSLTPVSQKFNAYEVFTGIGDSTKVFSEIGYQYRANDSVRNSVLKRVSTSNTYYLKSKIVNTSNAQLSLFANYRVLKNEEIPSDSAQGTTDDEQFLNSRLLYNQLLLNGGIRLNTAVESNNGIIPQQEFTYVQVASGEGTYTWNDYNNNGIQELEEFEVAQFQDKAEYVRILLPNQIFIKIRETKFSQTIILNPQQWASQDGFKKVMSHFYNQTSYLIDKKARRDKDVFFINPFKDAGEDELTQISNLRNVIYYNRGKQHFSTSYTLLSSSNGNLLSIGLVEVKLKSHQLNFNHKVGSNWLLNFRGALGKNESRTENFENRNYTLESYEFNPKLSYLLDNQTRFDVFYQFLNEENIIGELEQLDQHKIGVSFSYSNAQKVSFNGEFNYIDNAFQGNAFSPIGYQILEGLQPGVNLTWRFLLQKKITKFLDLNLSYFGRKSETSSAIHTGTVQLRAYF